MRSFALRAYPILLALAAAACGQVDSPPPPDAGPQNPDGLKSGSRLKLRWADFGGTKVYAGMQDATRNEQCSPRKFADAKTYCVPQSNTVVYRDAGCTMPIGRQFVSCPVVEYQFFTETDPLTCDNLPTKIYPRGAQLSLPTYYTLSFTAAGTTTCLATTTGTTTQLFALGPEVALTEFAQLDEEAPAQGRIQQRYLQSGDGARVFNGYLDDELDSTCVIAFDANRAGGKCLPSSVTVPGYIFGDAACTSPRVPFRKGCQVPKLTAQSSRSCLGMATIPELFQTGAVSSASYSNSSGQCAAFTVDAGTSYYALTTTKFEPASVTRGPDTASTARLRPIYSNSGGNQLRDSLLFDSMLATECAPTTMQDGSVRCLPVSPYGTTTAYSSDAACANRLTLILVPNAPAAGCTLPSVPPAATTTTVQSTPCNVTREVRPLTPYTGPLYRTNIITGACTAETITTSTVYQLGTAMPADMFPAAVVSTEM